MKIPSMILRQLYTYGSLENIPGGIRFGMKNRLSSVSLTGISRVKVNGGEIPIEELTLHTGNGPLQAIDVGPKNPLSFPLRQTVHVEAGSHGILESGKHRIELDIQTKPFGRLRFSVEDSIGNHRPQRAKVPYDRENDTTAEAIRTRQDFVQDYAGVELRHLMHYSLDPATTEGNIESFAGVAQVPIGIAGPILVNGEHASGEFLVPLATTEGTLVASYNRGIKLLNMSGGVTCTVAEDCMQRAPVFVFESAREARTFTRWVDEHMDEIREAAEETSSFAKLLNIDAVLSNKFAFIRFNYTTGDAAGQNMVGRATFAACGWIIENNDSVRKFYLESNLAADKKPSQVNVLRTRGKRVIAEVTVPREILIEQLRVEPEVLLDHYNIGGIGSSLSGTTNNGLHSANAIAALFVATGQDVANVAESSAGILFAEKNANGDLYVSFTLPSLIVATFGGGTGLATQRECLEIMGCGGTGKVRKFAEIVAGVALAGELSLAGAISSLDWVDSHERYGRNR